MKLKHLGLLPLGLMVLSCLSPKHRLRRSPDAVDTGGQPQSVISPQPAAVTLSDLGVNLSHASSSNLPALSLDQLVKTARQNNFDTLIKAQELYRAREEMLLARGRLLPSINLGTIIAGIEGPMGLIGEVGNLLPFLFPSNWYKKNASEEMYAAEQYSFRALRANQINIIEGLYYAILRDREYLKSVENRVLHLATIKQRIDKLVAGGEAPSSWANLVSIEITEGKDDLISMDQYVSSQIVLLQKLTGAQPDRQAYDLQPLQVPTIDNSLIRDLKPEEQQAIVRSLELAQIGHLQEAARSNTSAAAWSWLDPNTDERFNLGFGLDNAINVERSAIAELESRKGKVVAEISEEIINIEKGIQVVVEQHKLATQAYQDSKASYEAAMKQLGNGEITLFELVELVGKIYKYETKMSASAYIYLILRSKVERLVLEGYYKN